MDERIEFWGLYSVCQVFLLAALVVKPSPNRWSLFIPIIFLTIYLLFFTSTGNLTRDDIVGSVMLAYLFTATDYILLTDVQRELRLQGQKGPISDASLLSRLQWGLKLFTSPRGVGWAHEVPHLPARPRHSSRTAFVFLQLAWMGVYALAYDLIGIFSRWNFSCLHQNACFTHIAWLWRIRVLFGFMGSAYSMTCIMFCIVSILSVVSHASEPKDWPPLYGRWVEAYTLRRFWSRTWHQLLRRSLSSHAEFIAHRVFGLARGTRLSAYVQLYSAFFISGMIHHGGEYMMFKHWGGSGMRFFLAQPVAIMLEDLVIQAWSNGRKADKPCAVLRLLGCIWVASWFTMTLNPVICAQMLEEGMQFSIVLGLRSGNWFPTVVR
ncbi:hypothetical protein BDN72DRAFT_764224 [Pluteus cervinus]|uniref:Uncharacterized protein n=1 Tax=Pluteus cervinus TaxID=181527 RepID=A0ACD3B231_9AGAR|nr:hypothetical protein BDN72DRAFT_764224 [Pluteus cervinus]